MARSSRLAALLLLAATAPLAPARGGDRPAAPGEPAALAPEFLLEASDGTRVSLHAERQDRVGTVVLFLDEQCPVSARACAAIARLVADYADQGFTFLLIDATADCDAKSAAAFAKANGLPEPLLLDPQNSVAPRFELARGAAAVVLDRELQVVYRGALDDRPADGSAHARHEFVADALEALLIEEAPAVAATEPPGRPLAASTRAVTFHGDVAPLLHRECADCHRPGQVGPMALLDFDDAQGWAPQIAEVTGNGRMPPWHADPRHGRFQNERRLTDTQKALLARWAAAGAPEGDAKQKRTPPVYDDGGWAIGTPDLVIQLDEPQPIPADGYVDYRYELVDPKITEDLWVQACEIRPTARDATHHVLALYIPPGKSPLSALSGLQDGSIIGAGYFAVQVPGCRPNLYPEGAGKKIEKGAKFLFQLHYTPNGKATSDQCQLGFKFCATPPKDEVKTRGVFSYNLRIPPNEARYVTTASFTFPKATRLISMFPHMHTRGSAFKFEKVSGKGDDAVQSVLCDVPKYDFNWQNFYLPEEPVRFAAGETLLCTAAYDNSKGNPFNPDPNRMVFWGEQTYEEMMIGYIDYIEEK
ncbi:MAG: redoxin domain-containing protein [Planctomycetes bacterium]|nr:redoxin domain-containing protein [Planctomycetota bacterium]